MSSSKNNFNVALLGAGIFAKQSHLPAILSTPQFTLTSVYSRSYTSAESLASLPTAPKNLSIYSDDSHASSTGSLDELLSKKELDIVILALPIMTQPEVIRKAWKAGKCVISEKPIAPTVEAARELIKEYEQEYRGKGIGWIVAEQFPYETSFSHAREQIRNGKIGDLKNFRLDLYHFVEEDSKYNNTQWRKKPDYQGGYLLDGGVHFVAGLRTVLSSQSINITNLSSIATSLQPHLPPHDTLTGFFSTDSIAQGTFYISFGMKGLRSCSCMFVGDLGSIEIIFGHLKHTLKTTLLGQEVPELIEWDSEGVANEFVEFGKAFQHGFNSQKWIEVERKSGPKATLRDLTIIEAGLKSHGNKVDLKELIGEENWVL